MARPSLGATRLGRPAGVAPLVIVLGDRVHTLDSWLQPLCGDYSLVALESPRSADPRRFGVPTRSGDWYLDDDLGPDPASFGLALIALERFVLHERSLPAEPGRAGGGQPPVLMGIGQGATLCLALAGCWAEALAGVVAIGGRLVELPADAIEETPLLQLPILLGAPAEIAARDHAFLVERGGCVTLVQDAGSVQTTPLLASWLRDIVRSRSDGTGFEAAPQPGR
jgi:hypothetical protein